MQDDHAPVCALQVGIASGQYTAIIPASQTNTYTSTTICGTFAANYSYIDPGLFSSANLTKLEPATKYFYRVGAIVSPAGYSLILCGSAERPCIANGRLLSSCVAWLAVPGSVVDCTECITIACRANGTLF